MNEPMHHGKGILLGANRGAAVATSKLPLNCLRAASRQRWADLDPCTPFKNTLNIDRMQNRTMKGSTVQTYQEK